MKQAIRQHRTKAQRGSPFAARRGLLFTLFCLIAFSLQSYVAATHIHDLAGPGPGYAIEIAPDASAEVAAVAEKTPQPGHHNRVPARDDDCPLCNAVAHAGAFLFPALLVFSLPSDGVVIASAVSSAPVIAEPLSHSWESRGPPHA
ncbi:MAG TPA: DUF2946 family protein [Rhizomicrobium sp.]